MFFSAAVRSTQTTRICSPSMLARLYYCCRRNNNSADLPGVCHTNPTKNPYKLRGLRCTRHTYEFPHLVIWCYGKLIVVPHLHSLSHMAHKRRSERNKHNIYIYICSFISPSCPANHTLHVCIVVVVGHPALGWWSTLDWCRGFLWCQMKWLYFRR